MIGHLTFDHGGARVTATLDNDLRWRNALPAVLERLELAFAADPVPGVPVVAVGRHLLYQAASRLGGTVRLPSLPRREPEPLQA